MMRLEAEKPGRKLLTEGRPEPMPWRAACKVVNEEGRMRNT